MGSLGNKSYVERDISTLRQKIIQMVKDEASNWTDFNETDLGMVYIEVLAGCADMLNYYLDKQANEVFLDRAEEPKNIRSILQTINYRIPLRRSAEGNVRFINPSRSLASDVVIKKYTQLTTSQGSTKKYVTKEERVLVAGEEMVEVPVIQGARVEVKETAERLKREWKYYLNTSSLADKTVRIVDSLGEWVEVDDAFLKYEGGRYFSVHRDPDDKLYILVTWDWKAQLPVDNSEMVTIQYIDTLADKGQTGEYTIDTILDVITDVEGRNVNSLLLVNNPEAITGGTGDVPIYKQIVDAKNNVKMMGKLVTLEDYANAASAYNGVFKSVTQDWSVPNNSVSQPYKVISWVIPPTDSKLSDGFLSVMSKDLYKRGIAIVEYSAIQAEVVKFDVEAQIKIKSDNVEFRGNVRRQVIQVLQDTFSYGKLEFGQAVFWDDIRDIIKHANSAITTVTVQNPSVDIVTTPIQYPALGAVKIEIVGDYYGL